MLLLILPFCSLGRNEGIRRVEWAHSIQEIEEILFINWVCLCVACCLKLSHWYVMANCELYALCFVLRATLPRPCSEIIFMALSQLCSTQQRAQSGTFHSKCDVSKIGIHAHSQHRYGDIHIYRCCASILPRYPRNLNENNKLLLICCYKWKWCKKIFRTKNDRE